MSREPLTVENLDRGKMQTMANEALKRVIRDVAERPYVQRARKVKIEVDIVPDQANEEGFVVNAPIIGYKVTQTIPAYVGKTVVGEIKRNPEGVDELLVNVDLPGLERGQTTFLDGQEVSTKTGEVIEMKRKNGEE